MRKALTQLVTDGDMSANITSSVQQLDQAIGYCIQAVFTTNGTLAGTFKLQGSVNHNEVPYGFTPVTGTWTDITNSSYTISAAGDYMWDVQQPGYRWVRLVYTKAMSDTGVLNAYCFERAM